MKNKTELRDAAMTTDEAGIRYLAWQVLGHMFTFGYDITQKTKKRESKDVRGSAVIFSRKVTHRNWYRISIAAVILSLLLATWFTWSRGNLSKIDWSTGLLVVFVCASSVWFAANSIKKLGLDDVDTAIGKAWKKALRAPSVAEVCNMFVNTLVVISKVVTEDSDTDDARCIDALMAGEYVMDGPLHVMLTNCCKETMHRRANEAIEKGNARIGTPETVAFRSIVEFAGSCLCDPGNFYEYFEAKFTE